MLLFIVSGVGKCPIKDVIRETLPMVLIELAVLFIIAYVPGTVMALVNMVS